jgi:D-ribose pyranase
MIQTSILNPRLLALLGRVRHTNRLVIADCMFPSWPGIEELDLSLVAGVPTVPQVLAAVISCWQPGAVWMAEEFLVHNDLAVRSEFDRALGGALNCRVMEPHPRLKERVPGATGLIRTGEMRIYTNVVMESR